MLAAKIILGFCLIKIVSSNNSNISQAQIDSAFESFKLTFNKNYESSEEEVKRKAIFTEKYLYIQNFNAERAPLKLQLTDYSDKTRSEFRGTYIRPRINKTISYDRNYYKNMQVPNKKDWNAEGKVTSVKDQGDNCGCCWNFAALAALESRNAIKGKKLESFSAQYILECKFRDGCGDDDASVHYPNEVWDYIKEKGGVAKDECYPFVSGHSGSVGKCKRSKAEGRCWVKMKPNSKVRHQMNEEDIKKEVGKNGPVAVDICARDSLQNWSKDNGIYKDDECNKEKLCDEDNDWHAVSIVGYGTEKGQDYWLLKNSWGDSFCDKGFVKWPRNTNKPHGYCFIADDVYIPTVSRF